MAAPDIRFTRRLAIDAHACSAAGGQVLPPRPVPTAATRKAAVEDAIVGDAVGVSASPHFDRVLSQHGSHHIRPRSFLCYEWLVRAGEAPWRQHSNAL